MKDSSIFGAVFSSLYSIFILLPFYSSLEHFPLLERDERRKDDGAVKEEVARRMDIRSESRARCRGRARFNSLETAWW